MSQLMDIHEQQKSCLRAFLQQEGARAPIILYGVKGIGKMENAKKVLNEHCKKELHLELVVLKPESKLNGYTIEQIHTFTKQVNIKPFQKTLRVIFFEDAHRLMPIHANALLKTIEELHQSILVFFITHNIAQVLHTIQSRCLKIYFKALSKEHISKVMNISMDSSIVKRAEGSIQRAQIFVDKEFICLQKALFECVKAVFADRFDLVIHGLEQIQKGLEKKPRAWVKLLLEGILYFQLDRVRLNKDYPGLVFHEFKDDLYALKPYFICNPQALCSKINALLSHHEMGVSTKYILENVLFFLILE